MDVCVGGGCWWVMILLLYMIILMSPFVSFFTFYKQVVDFEEEDKTICTSFCVSTLSCQSINSYAFVSISGRARALLCVAYYSNQCFVCQVSCISHMGREEYETLCIAIVM